MQIEYYYFCFFLFALVAYFIVTDESVAKAFHYLSKLMQNEYNKKKWWLLHNPRNPLVKYFMWRRAMKLAKELQKEFDKNEI